MKLKGSYATWKVLAVVATILPIACLGNYLNKYYRPRAFNGENLTPIIASSGAGFLAVIISVLLFQLFRKKINSKQLKFDILLNGVFYNTVELASAFIDSIGTFDINDIIAYSLATVLMYLIVHAYNKAVPSKESTISTSFKGQ